MSKIKKLSIALTGAVLFSFLFNSIAVLNQKPNYKTTKEQEKKNYIKNFKLERRRVIDSLIDEKALTVDNLRLVEKRFPDSLCGCN